jgi:hypothetical protein
MFVCLLFALFVFELNWQIQIYTEKSAYISVNIIVFWVVVETGSEIQAFCCWA